VAIARLLGNEEKAGSVGALLRISVNRRTRLSARCGTGSARKRFKMDRLEIGFTLYSGLSVCS